MNISSFFFLALFSIFSSSVMTYIALATMIGPWMGPTLILIALVITSVFRSYSPQDMLLPVIGGALGGIIATGIGFSFPTFYFINQAEFMSYADTPYILMSIVAGLSLVAGFFALAIVEYCKKDLLEEQKLPFPVGKLVYDIAISSDHKKSQKQLLWGIFGTLVYFGIHIFLKIKNTLGTFVYDGSLTIVKAYNFGICKVSAIRFDMGLLPMFVAIGFISGHLMTVPLLLGAVLRVICIDTLRNVYFQDVSDADFMFAFCSGIVAIGFVLHAAKMIQPMIRGLSKYVQLYRYPTSSHNIKILGIVFKLAVVVSGACAYFGFSVASALYAALATAFSAYQIVVIAGKIGMSLLGRFATFVMVPGIFIFQISGLQATVVATFVELCGGIATELLFGLKTAQLAKLDTKEVQKHQIVGIVISSLTVGFVFWLLVTHFQLGSEQLFAQRAQSRALLIQAGTFNITVVLLGALCGLLLHLCKINTMLILGGLLMSLSMIIPLVIGGVLSWWVTKKERFEPLCSGIYATNSVMMIITALCNK